MLTSHERSEKGSILYKAVLTTGKRATQMTADDLRTHMRALLIYIGRTFDDLYPSLGNACVLCCSIEVEDKLNPLRGFHTHPD